MAKIIGGFTLAALLLWFMIIFCGVISTSCEDYDPYGRPQKPDTVYINGDKYVIRP